MTDVLTSDKDVIVEVAQPTIPPYIPPPKIGLVEINQVVQRGSAWLTGEGPPTGSGGQYGDMYLDMETGDIYQWNGSEWELVGTFAPSTDTPAEVLAKLITVDGAGSALDADLLDGEHGAFYAKQTDMDVNDARDDAQDIQINQNFTDIANLQANDSTQDSNIAKKVAKAGDTMTGPLTVVTPPTGAAHAASKAYVDGLVGGITNVPPATVPPLMDGAVSVGVATKYAREDHRHPSDTSKIGEAPNDGTQYVRQSLNWSPVNVPPGTVVSDTAPVSPQSGQMWLKSSTMVLYCWYVDPNTSQWVQVSASPQMVQNYSRTATRNNRVINGTFQVSQELNFAAVTAPGLYFADQFQMQLTGTMAVRATIGTDITPNGGSNKLQVSVQTADTSIAATDVAYVETRIEGLNIADLQWGTANAKQLILRYGFRAPAGTYHVSIANGANDRSYAAPIVVSAAEANTDTVRTVIIPGDTAGIWPNTNVFGMQVRWVLAAGSSFEGTAGWQAGNKLALPGGSNGVGSTSNAFVFSDIGLYADPDKTGLAPPFEIEDYATTLAKCRRYYNKLTNRWVIAGWAGIISQAIFSQYCYPTAMRTGATAASTASGAINVSGGLTFSAGNATDSMEVRATSAAVGQVSIVADAITLNARM